ncbi:MAG TPA: bis(5'-nucleosyl)-tetraphosphatase (symmetrical) YqeK, partial [Candidatus Obscuribacterales bacterium]
SLDFARRWAEPRVSAKRFRHVEGVARVAREIAEKCNVDPFLAELSGWLHDACKEVKDKELVVMARSFGLRLHPIEEENGHLLHGPVAAQVVKNELGITHQPLLDAISEHTLGAVGMSELSKVSFLADCLEESRPRDFADPIWDALGWKGTKKGNRLDIDRAMLVACDMSLDHLLKSQRVIHPRTIEVRNWFLKIVRERTN